MPKIKVFQYVDQYDDYDNSMMLSQGITDWEDVSEEDFHYLRANLNLLRRNPSDYSSSYVIVEQPEGGAVQAIRSIKETIAAAKKAEADRKAAAAAKQAADKAKKAAKAKDKELQQLKKLQEKYAAELN